MDEITFKERTRKFGLAIIQLVEKFPNSKTADVIGRQILRSATSVGANYRAACRAKSSPDMLNKLKIVEEEADESLYWLEIIKDAKIAPDCIGSGGGQGFAVGFPRIVREPSCPCPTRRWKSKP